MAQRDLLKRYLDAGMAFTAMTKSRAEGIVRELVRAGEISRDQVQGQVDELIERSRRNTDHLVALVRKEVTSQLADASTALRDEFRALERRLNGAVPGTTEAAKAPGATKAPGAKKTTGKRAPAKQASSETAPSEAKADKAAPAKKTGAAKKSAPAEKAAAANKAAPAKKAAGAKKAAPAADPGAGAGAVAAPEPKRVPAKRAAAKKAPAKRAPAPPSGESTDVPTAEATPAGDAGSDAS